MNILVINPDLPFVHNIRVLLEREGYRTSVANDIASALIWLEENRPDLLIIDRDLLVSEGQALLQILQRHGDLPTIFLTSAISQERALEYHVPRLDQIEHILRQAKPAVREMQIIHVAELLVDLAKKRAIFRGKRLPLTPIQFRLLSYLAGRTGQVVGYQELLKQVWGYESDDQEARELLKTHIRQIRRKMGLRVKNGEYLVSVRGFGYMLISPEEDRPLQQGDGEIVVVEAKSDSL